MNKLIIEKAPQNWQIIQQKNGFANIVISGEAFCDYSDASVCIRVLNESSYIDVIKPIFITPVNNKWCSEFILPAGGLYTITIFLRYAEREFDSAYRITHIGVGDNYIIAGQSNASGNSKDLVEDPYTDKVHLFKLNGKWDIATHPLHDATNAIYPDIYKEYGFHSPWLAFARKLSENLGYPIGLIPTAVGGTPLSFWNREQDGHLFESMLKMVELSGSEVKGIIWYQGCNDTANEDDSKSYLERFKTVCEDFRKSFYKDIPIITIQLNKQTYILKERVISWGVIREAQRQAAKVINNVYIVPSIDLPLCDTVHNCASSNLVISQRVLNVALKYIYNRDAIGDFPDIDKAIQVSDEKIHLTFNNVVDSLATDYLDVENLALQVEDENGVNNIKEIIFNRDNSVEILVERKLENAAKISCSNLTYTGAVLYDLLTRYPMLAFDNISIEKRGD